MQPAKVVVVLGAGVAGSNAAAGCCRGCEADVTVIDRDLNRLRALDTTFKGTLRTIASSEHAIEEACLQADLVIGAVLVAGARAPHLVSNELVAAMLEGSVLVDISVDQGGCFESSRPTTHSAPTFEAFGSIFYCVANMPGAVPFTSTHALTNVTLPYTLPRCSPSTPLDPVPSLTAPAPMPADHFVKVVIPLYDEGHVPGGLAHPGHDLSPERDAQPVWSFSQTQPSGTGTVSITYSRAMPSGLVLPVVPGVKVPTPLPPCQSLRNEP